MGAYEWPLVIGWRQMIHTNASGSPPRGRRHHRDVACWRTLDRCRTRWDGTANALRFGPRNSASHRIRLTECSAVNGLKPTLFRYGVCWVTVFQFVCAFVCHQDCSKLWPSSSPTMAVPSGCCAAITKWAADLCESETSQDRCDRMSNCHWYQATHFFDPLH